MLENRPIAQKSLIGVGAFAFVFLAAMSGTAFMISGGFGGGEGQRSSGVSEAYASNSFAIHSFDTSPTASTTALTSRRPVQEATFDPSSSVDVEPAAHDVEYPAAMLDGDSGSDQKDDDAADDSGFPTTNN